MSKTLRALTNALTVEFTQMCQGEISQW